MSKVLIVDDERGMRNTMRQFLEIEGYEVLLAEHADEAIEHLAAHDIRVVVTDIVMPRVSGVELLRRIQEQDKRIKVILITGEPTVDTAAAAIRSGAYDYLTKPLSRDRLCAVVGSAISLYRLEEENRRYRDNLETLVEERTDALKKSQGQLEKSYRKLNRALDGVIKAMALTVETRDPYTSGHQRRVAHLAKAIATEMKLPDDTVDAVTMAAAIHDIGKISIPAEILSKPGKLSEIEFDIIRTHCTVGYEILEPIDFPWPLANIVLQHHERLDGSGYPHGLSGDDIRLESRIIMVADVVEAIASHRPYRPALGIDIALDEITSRRNGFYDSDVVEACMTLFQSREYTLIA